MLMIGINNASSARTIPVGTPSCSSGRVSGRYGAGTRYVVVVAPLLLAVVVMFDSGTVDRSAHGVSGCR